MLASRPSPSAFGAWPSADVIHYHGTPITPMTALHELAGRHFCVSFSDPRDCARCHAIGSSVMLDNGAFSLWRKGRPTDWPGYYSWADEWLNFPTTWGVIPDVIDGSEEEQDELLRQWPFGLRGAPVWHMNESIERLLSLLDRWPRVCIGSTSVFSVVLSDPWQLRMDEVWDEISRRGWLPWVHMLRGMATSGQRWPFDRHRPKPQQGRRPSGDGERWDAMQCPGGWEPNAWAKEQERRALEGISPEVQKILSDLFAKGTA